MIGALVAGIAIGVPALVFTLWPLLRRGGGAVLLPLPVDEREQWLEAKGAALRALRELAFEHDAGHISDADYAELRARYESEAAAALTALDRLGAAPVPTAAAPPRATPAAARAWRHPMALAASALALLVFGVLLGVGIVRYTEPDRTAAMPPSIPPMTAMPETPASGDAPRKVPPEVLRGMLQAARGSLSEGRYPEAIAAYQAVLKRDPKNVDAMTHLGLIVAIGGHADSALETFDKALAIDPDYAPALLYRGQVLYEVKKDVAGAVSAWERFVKVAPSAEERERVKKLIADAKAESRGR
ncbi:MAG TPA: tetratricopeptide repeat protein [Methylomirabilota bacterium]|nr:tetratricopeptide repeat protein [Methylomirabilota bacterium]